MILTREQFDSFLSNLAFHYWLAKDYRDKLFNIGLNPDHWPSFIGAKTALQEFFFHERHNNYSFAQMALNDKFVRLNHSFLDDDILIIREKYLLNLKHYQAFELGERICNNPDKVENLINEFKLNKPNKHQAYNVADILMQTLQHNENLIASGKNKIILKDFELLSDQIGGFNPARVSLISAKSGFGKTKLAVNLAASASRQMKVIYFNMEMGLYDFMPMFIQRYCRISNKEWQSGSYIYKEDKKAAILDFQQNVANQNIFITDGRTLSLNDIESLSISTINQGELGLLIVDYDQKISLDSKIDEWMGVLKAIEYLEQLAIRLGVHVIVLCQGDDAGDPKSSKRAIQPASSVIAFSKSIDDSTYILKSIKNRYGPNDFKIQVHYEAQYSIVKEIGFYNELPQHQILANMLKKK